MAKKIKGTVYFPSGRSISGIFESTPNIEELGGGFQHTDVMRGIDDNGKVHTFPAASVEDIEVDEVVDE